MSSIGCKMRYFCKHRHVSLVLSLSWLFLLKSAVFAVTMQNVTFVTLSHEVAGGAEFYI